MRAKQSIKWAALVFLLLPTLVMAGEWSGVLSKDAKAVQSRYEACLVKAKNDLKAKARCRVEADRELAKLEQKAQALVNQKKTSTEAQHADALRAQAELKKMRGALALVEQQEMAQTAKPKDKAAEPAPAAEAAEDEVVGLLATRDQAQGRAQDQRAKREEASKRTALKGTSTKSLDLYNAPARPAPRHVMPPRPEPMPEPEPVSQEPSFKHHGTNAMKDTSKEAFSTFAADVDTGSYTLARSKIQSGILPPADAVRVEEFVNYFAYNNPQPKQGPFAVALEAAPSPFVASKDRYIMRVGIQGKKITAAERKPVHLTFLVDVSGSMNRHDKLGLAKQALRVLTENLKPQDTVAIATYASGSQVILPPTSVKERDKILESLSQLKAQGSTAMNDGLGLAYKLALTNFKRDHVNRVIVMSDGDANVGPSSHDAILGQIKKYVDEGVTLSTIGFGMGTYRDHLMEQLANKGNGNYYYIDSIDEANKVFGAQLDGTLQVIAKDVKLQVEFNPKAVKQYRLIGYENRVMDKKDFRDDQKDAGEIGAGHTVTAMYELVLVPGSDAQEVATVRIRHKEPDGYKATESAFPLRRMELKGKLVDASHDLQFSTAVAAFAEILRDSPYAKGLSYDLVHEVAAASLCLVQGE